MPDRSTEPAIDLVDTSYLDSLVGYNARRASLVIIEVFIRQMAVYALRPVDFSVLSLIGHNPGLTSRQLCASLSIQPPNLVGLLNTLEKRKLVKRSPHPRDGRAMGLHLTPAGNRLMAQAEQTALSLEQQATAGLSVTQRTTLIKLLKKVYESGPQRA